jgi:hypothetical protein
MPEVQKISHTHDAIIDEMLVNPKISQGELAKMFGYTQSWMCIVMNSSAFRERFLERKEEIVDPILRARMADNVEKASSAASRALDRILNRLESDATAAGIKTADLVSIAKLDLAPKSQMPAVQNNNLYVVNLPPQAKDSAAWVQQVRTPGGLPLVVENTPGV